MVVVAETAGIRKKAVAVLADIRKRVAEAGVAEAGVAEAVVAGIRKRVVGVVLEVAGN